MTEQQLINKVENLKTMYESGELTQHEYVELIRDMADVKNISERLQLQGNLIKVQQIAATIQSVAGVFI